ARSWGAIPPVRPAAARAAEPAIPPDATRYVTSDASPDATRYVPSAAAPVSAPPEPPGPAVVEDANATRMIPPDAAERLLAEVKAARKAEREPPKAQEAARGGDPVASPDATSYVPCASVAQVLAKNAGPAAPSPDATSYVPAADVPD